MMNRTIFVLATLSAATLLLAAVACGDDSERDSTPSATASGPPDLSPRVGGVEAAQRYLQETGIDGDKGSFTDPLACAKMNDDTEGDFCIHEDFSTYAAGLVILRVADRDKPDEDVWEMRLSLTDGLWRVDSVEPFGDNS